MDKAGFDCCAYDSFCIFIMLSILKRLINRCAAGVKLSILQPWPLHLSRLMGMVGR